jgi:hypothetical protein
MMFRSLALAATLALSAGAAAQPEFYFSVRGALGDVDGPRLTTGSDASTFGTVGSMFALGVSGGAWRVEFEVQNHETESFDSFFFVEDEIGIGSVMLNLVVDPLYSNNLRPVFGVGVGFTTVTVDIDNCYDFNGCGPNSPDTHAESTAGAFQYMAGLVYRNGDAGWEIGAYYRWFKSSDLQMTTDFGEEFEDDQLRMSMVTLEVNLFF